MDTVLKESRVWMVDNWVVVGTNYRLKSDPLTGFYATQVRCCKGKDKEKNHS